MGCGCGSTPTIVASEMVAPQYQVQPTNFRNEPCDYTLEQITSWLNKVNCFKDNAYQGFVPSITNTQLNIYIGTLMSVQNFRGNICYYKPELEEIESFIIVITSLNLCQEN